MILCRILHVNPRTIVFIGCGKAKLVIKNSPSCQVARHRPKTIRKCFHTTFRIIQQSMSIWPQLFYVFYGGLLIKSAPIPHAQYPSFAWWIHLVCYIPFQICIKAGRMKWIYLQHVSLRKAGSQSDIRGI